MGVLMLLGILFAVPPADKKHQVGHPIQFQSQEWVELTFTSFIGYVEKNEHIPASRYLSNDFMDSEGRKREAFVDYLISLSRDDSKNRIRFSNIQVSMIGEDVGLVLCEYEIKDTTSSDKPSKGEIEWKVEKRGEEWKVLSVNWKPDIKPTKKKDIQKEEKPSLKKRKED